MKVLKHKTNGRILEWTPHLAKSAELEPYEPEEAAAPVVAAVEPAPAPEAPKRKPLKAHKPQIDFGDE